MNMLCFGNRSSSYCFIAMIDTSLLLFLLVTKGEKMYNVKYFCIVFWEKGFCIVFWEKSFYGCNKCLYLCLGEKGSIFKNCQNYKLLVEYILYGYVMVEPWICTELWNVCVFICSRWLVANICKMIFYIEL